MFATPADQRWFEDYVPGDVHEFGPILVEEEEIIAFARRYDPQLIHTDPVAARDGPFGGLIGSGWMTTGLMMRLYCQHYLSTVASIASPGIDELRWTRPTRPGDQLWVRVTIREARQSQSKPDRGLVRSDIEVFNQAGETVMTMKALNLFLCRPAG